MSAINNILSIPSIKAEYPRQLAEAIAELDQKDKSIDYAFGILEKLAKMLGLLGGEEYKELLPKVASLVELLRESEWEGNDEGTTICWKCRGMFTGDGHEKDCVLAAAIKELGHG